MANDILSRHVDQQGILEDQHLHQLQRQQQQLLRPNQHKQMTVREKHVENMEAVLLDQTQMTAGGVVLVTTDQPFNLTRIHIKCVLLLEHL
jgi:hypothetical protein